jgi:hypothetical protein
MGRNRKDYRCPRLLTSEDFLLNIEKWLDRGMFIHERYFLLIATKQQTPHNGGVCH